MNTLDVIKTRRAVRDWTSQDVSDEMLNQILEAGRWAPSPLNSQAWTFIVIRNKETIEKLTPDAQHGSFISKANVIIVVTIDKNAKVDEWLSHHEQHVLSGGCAIENMWLVAHDLGLGGCWVTLDKEGTKTLLNLPDGQILIGSLALGYPAEAAKPHLETDRKQLSESTFYEFFYNRN